MSIQKEKSKRRILPRWRDSTLASKNADFLSLKPLRFRPTAIEPQITEAATDFHSSPSIGTASELLSSALLGSRHNEATMAAEFLVTHSDTAPQSVLGLARGFLSGSNDLVTVRSEGVQHIAKLRSLLRLQPRNAMLWSDMARHYASLGDRGRAFRCMQTAIGLAPQHRWLLRTMARFLVNQDDPASAHKLLANHPRTRNDPWLIAAEIACAQVAGRAPKFWRQAGDILRFETFSPIHTTELATAVAMMELEEGARKKAKKLVQKGLISPTENTLAQVFWAQENQHLPDGIELNELVRSAHNAYEADYRLKMTEGDLLGAMDSAQEWYNDEPFSARPCSDIAYIASLIDDHQKTIEMATKAKRLYGKTDSSLELNVIFAKLSSGRLDQNTDCLEIEHIKHRLMAIVEQANGDSYHAVANLGLWHYRFGSHEVASIMYQKAIEVAVKLRTHEAAAMASIFATREAILASDPHAAVFLQQSKDLVGKAKSKSAEFYMRKIDALAVNPDQALAILNPKNAANYLSIAKPAPKIMKIDISPKGATIWIKK